MPALLSRLRRRSRTLALSWTLFVVVGLVVGLAIAPFAPAARVGGQAPSARVDPAPAPKVRPAA
ncbi:hypothetical protein BRC81_09720 [Halobacteriales archaeon QS_1_68_20]|nr:MAG: hypothetical protein BRC81_09720 [Halobacteriales archaeon QS_1_68_20]